MDAKLLEILVCPVTKAPLIYDRQRQEHVDDRARQIEAHAVEVLLLLGADFVGAAQLLLADAPPGSERTVDRSGLWAIARGGDREQQIAALTGHFQLPRERHLVAEIIGAGGQ